ncbi:DNA polymerase I [Patescibacteria group bacterium]
MKQTLVILDTHALIHRSFHALPPLSSPSGEPINAVYGLSSVLIKLLRELNPTHVAAAFDLPEPTFRHIAYEEYKAQRPETPNELSSQFEKAKEILKAFHIPILEAPGFEADDIIGTLVAKFKKEKNLSIIIASGDLDTLQLVDGDKVTVYTLRKGMQDTIIYDEKKVEERFGFSPELLPDFKGLKGDPSDNIPGVKGVGDKTATLLVQEYSKLEKMFQGLKSSGKLPKFMKETLKQRLLENEEEAFFSRELALIRKDAPVKESFKDFAWIFDKKDIEDVFRKFQFTSLLRRIRQDNQLANNNTDNNLSRDKIKILTKENNKELISFLENAKQIFILMRAGQLFLLIDGKNAWECSKAEIKNIKTEFSPCLKKLKIISYDSKEIISFLDNAGIKISKIDFDLKIASWLLNPELRNYPLENIISEYTNGESLNLIPQAFENLKKKLRAYKLEDVFTNIEMPTIPILSLMEKTGILVSGKCLEEISRDLKKALIVLEKDIFKISGAQFNIQSPNELREVLFERLNIEKKGIKKTSTKALSTKNSELLKLKNKHPIIEKIIRFRELSKLRSTYTDALPKLINSRDNRIHTTFHQEGTATGRLSSSNPNLQNIPVKTKEGQGIRKAFLASPGYLFASFDYSQLELRIAASLAEDKKMINAFNEGQDIHRITAAEINNIDLDAVTDSMRRDAKVVNFGILYGMGESALSESTGMSRDEAKRYMEEYFCDFEGIAKFIESIKQKAEQDGFVETLYGRRRFLPGIHSANFRIRKEAERMAINAPIQGTAADIVKRAMIDIDKECNLLETSIEKSQIRLLLQVHDELLFEIQEAELKKTLEKIKEIMQSCVEIRVPLIVDVKTGKNWADLK